MASWLKAAEDLFEVVDRRAKLVVGEKSDEQPVPSLGPNGRGSQAKRTRPRAKPQKKVSSSEASSALDIEREQTIPETLQSQAETDGNMPMPLIENSESNPVIPSGKVDSDETHKADRDGSTTETSQSETIPNDEAKPVDNHLDAETSSNAEAVASNLNGDIRIEEFVDLPLGNSSNAAKDVEVVNGDSPVDSNQSPMSEDAGSRKSIELSEPQTLHEDAPTKTDAQSKDVGLVVEPDISNGQQQEQKTVAVKVEEQLDEAQGLLKNAISTGQSKEARLARVCAGLSSRLQEYKSENAQLEELLVAERELTKSYEARIKQLQKELSASKGEVSRVEASMVEALSAKNAEIEALVSSVDGLKKQAALAEGNLASLQASMESIMRSRELTETRMMQALREELAAAERRAEEERSAHNSAKLAAREREVELEQRAIEASAALASIQRTADDRASKAAELEQKVALLEVECASLNQELQDMEARVRRGQKKSPEDANQAIQVQAWQEEVERARQGQREAESKLSSMEAEVQKMRVEMAAMKRDAEHYSRQEHMELEKRYRELTDLLYYKQTQLETMASEKAAAEFQLEKEVKRLQEAQIEAERNRASRRASSSWEEDTDLKALEPLPLHHRHMAGASLQLQKAAKLLDTGAVRATRFLWRYPTARVILLFYLVFVHLFLMYLLHRLQEQADSYTSKEVAESMGLLNKTLP
ncbi:Golgi integral membrane protein [Handroanthus impetiginosus]|uniref:Golgi integral membrane protein n=1 Tax=Handroanthus impetiginosus TaxID=429701 RepID=A0A2G9HSU9_9LAMI|nr:Golgi integral membrane protein [Handroanthus impetiginosus]